MQVGHEIVGDEGIKSFTSKVQTFVLVLSKSYKVQKGSLTFKLDDLIVQKIDRISHDKCGQVHLKKFWPSSGYLCAGYVNPLLYYYIITTRTRPRRTQV